MPEIQLASRSQILKSLTDDKQMTVDKHLKPSSYLPFFMAIGTIASLGGIFLYLHRYRLLAARLQRIVLPVVIPELAIMGMVSVGFACSSISFVMWHRAFKKCKCQISKSEDEKINRLNTYLKTNELFAYKNYSGEIVLFYNNYSKIHEISITDIKMFPSLTGYNNWCKENAQTMGNAHFIDFNTLRQRIR